jgi:hypothetical protein
MVRELIVKDFFYFIYRSPGKAGCELSAGAPDECWDLLSDYVKIYRKYGLYL